MEEVKLKTQPTMIKDKNIRTIDLSLIFPTIAKDEDVSNYEIMVSLLNTCSHAYPNEKDFSVEVSKRLILYYHASLRYIGENLYIRFDMSIPESKITPEYSIEDALKFFKETIYCPYANDDSFNENAFEREREYILARINDSKAHSIYYQSFTKFTKLVDPNEEIFLSVDSNLKYAENASAKRSYELYKEVILENDPLIYLFGNYEDSEIKPLLAKYFPAKKDFITIPLKYEKIFHPLKHDYIEETSKFNQTALFMLYDVSNYNSNEKEYLSLIGNILGQSENDLIFKQLRLYNNLVYSSDVTKYTYNGLILVETHLNYTSVNQAMELIKETFSSLKDKKFLQECINRLLKGLEVDMLRKEDSKYGKLVIKIDDDLKFRTIEYIYDCYKKMNIDDILSFIERIELNTIYVLRGENND